MNCVFSEVRLNNLPVPHHPALNNSVVDTAGGVFFELLLQIALRHFRFGEDQQPGGFSVEAVNNEELFRRAFALDVAEQIGVGSLLSLGLCGNGQEPRRFIQDDN